MYIYKPKKNKRKEQMHTHKKSKALTGTFEQEQDIHSKVEYSFNMIEYYSKNTLNLKFLLFVIYHSETRFAEK